MPRSIERQIKDTYFSLREGVAVIAFLLPPLLWVGGKIAGFPLRASMSAYYYATPEHPLPPVGPCAKADAAGATSADPGTLPAGTMRNWFVGLLFAVGAILYVYKGYTTRENIALNVAGLLAVGIALFPMPWTCGPSPRFTMHGTCAILFFVLIAYVCAFCSESTLVLITEPALRSRYRVTYRALAIVMVASPATSYIFNLITAQDSYIYWAELFGIYSFAVYWVIKIREVSSIGSEKKVFDGLA